MLTSNAPCAQFRIWRKELDSWILQLNQLKALKEMLDTFSTTAEYLCIFTQLAHVHHITTSFSPLSEDGWMDGWMDGVTHLNLIQKATSALSTQCFPKSCSCSPTPY
jgi:hypothetical protein